jgi:hypothetical protein
LVGAEPEGSGVEGAARPTVPNGDQFKVWTFHFRFYTSFVSCCNFYRDVTLIVKIQNYGNFEVFLKILVVKIFSKNTKNEARHIKIKFFSSSISYVF